MNNSYKKDNKKLKYLANIENHDFISDLIIKMKAKTVLDIGCFYGTLISNLRNKNWDGIYLGVDISESVLNIAKTKNPNECFILQNTLDLDIKEKYDIVIIGGVFYYLELSEAMQVLYSIKNKISDNILFHDVFRCRNKIYKGLNEGVEIVKGDFIMKNAGHNSHRKYIMIKY
tara:strand:- start:2275 stop:2793 length:519 start_codon:yes stop_codon:yes gene_type:complete